jgi:hypothetical protein
MVCIGSSKSSKFFTLRYSYRKPLGGVSWSISICSDAGQTMNFEGMMSVVGQLGFVQQNQRE